MAIPDDDIEEEEISLDLLEDEPEPPEIVDAEPELLMTSDETEKYLDDKYPEWRELPSTPPGVLMFGTISFSRAELDKWLERWTKYQNFGENDSLFP